MNRVQDRALKILWCEINPEFFQFRSYVISITCCNKVKDDDGCEIRHIDYVEDLLSCMRKSTMLPAMICCKY